MAINANPINKSHVAKKTTKKRLPRAPQVNKHPVHVEHVKLPPRKISIKQ